MKALDIYRSMRLCLEATAAVVEIPGFVRLLGQALPGCDAQALQRRLSVSAYVRTYETHALKEAAGCSDASVSVPD
jgi:hypothetical protein